VNIPKGLKSFTVILLLTTILGFFGNFTDKSVKFNRPKGDYGMSEKDVKLRNLEIEGRLLPIPEELSWMI
jgi:hypothetical protein